MSDAHRPTPGRAWPPGSEPLPARSARRRAVAAEAEALAADLAVLIESGLIVPIRRGATIRYAVGPDHEGAAV